MLFPASPFLGLGYLRPAPRWWFTACLLFLALLLQQPCSTEASASQNQSSIPGHPPPFLSLPTHPTVFLFFIFKPFFFFFKPSETTASNAPGAGSRTAGSTHETSLHPCPFCLGRTQRKREARLTSRLTSGETDQVRTKFPQRARQAESLQINKDLACPPPPTGCVQSLRLFLAG